MTFDEHQVPHFSLEIGYGLIGGLEFSAFLE